MYSPNNLTFLSDFKKGRVEGKRSVCTNFEGVAPSARFISHYFARTEAFVTRDIQKSGAGCVSRIRNFKSSADLDARKAGEGIVWNSGAGQVGFFFDERRGTRAESRRINSARDKRRTLLYET